MERASGPVLQESPFTGLKAYGYRGKWQVSVILYIWDQWFILWKQRNQEVHGHDGRTNKGDSTATRTTSSLSFDIPAAAGLRAERTGIVI